MIIIQKFLSAQDIFFSASSPLVLVQYFLYIYDSLLIFLHAYNPSRAEFREICCKIYSLVENLSLRLKNGLSKIFLEYYWHVWIIGLL